MTGESSRPTTLRAVVERVEELSASDKVSIGEMVAAFGRTSFVPALTIPALIVVTPLSGIPGLSSLCGIVIALIALQMTIRRSHLWVPGVIARRRISGGRLRDATGKLHKVAAWGDRHARPRLRILLHEPFASLSRAAAACCGLAMPFLEFVPFSSSILGAAVLTFAIGFLASDGLWILGAGLFLAAGIAIPVTLAL